MNPSNPWGLYSRMDTETKSPIKANKVNTGSLTKASTLKDLYSGIYNNSQTNLNNNESKNQTLTKNNNKIENMNIERSINDESQSDYV